MENITRYYEVGFESDGIYSVNIITANVGDDDLAAVTETAERHAQRYGYTVAYVAEKPEWYADECRRKGMPVYPIDDESQRKYGASVNDAQDETPANYSIVNNETGKLELHFAKATYMALDDDAKGKIRSNFLWSRRSACWISRCKEPNLDVPRRIANDLGLFDAGETDGDAHDEQRDKRAKVAAVDRDLLREQYAMVWGKDKRMVDYCVNKVAAMAILPGNEIVVIDKQQIETRFCFGESGYDYDDAMHAAQHARTSVDHFKRENMKHHDEMIESLTACMNDDNNERLVIYTGGAYINQDTDCRLRNFGFAKMCDIIDACGGSCYTSELPGKELTVCFQKCRVATHEELTIILDAYKAARQTHERKVDAYLKRYGLSKVHAWTYWRDA